MSKSALIVDDNDAMRGFLTYVLEKDGFATVCACNGREALQYMVSSQFELVLMDIEMPLLNGVDCTRCIRIMEDALDRHPTVIGMTAGDYRRDHCLQSGMDELLRKPFSPKELLGATARLAAHINLPEDAHGPS
jgi:two-component system sensor histidine kinase/response regulator